MRIAEYPSLHSRIPNSTFRIGMVGLDRFELSTSRLSGVRSNQLSYRPLKGIFKPSLTGLLKPVFPYL